MSYPSRFFVALWLVIAMSPIPALAQETPDPMAVRAAIDSGNAAYIKAYAHEDAAALAQVYDPDGARLNSNGLMARGREAIAASVGAFLKRVGPVRVRLETVDMWVTGDHAYETGIWTYTYTPPDAAERTIGGRYVTVWRQHSDGRWRILADLGVPGTSLPSQN